jgi:tetratricopeptide (TPR) repeat protein
MARNADSKTAEAAKLVSEAMRLMEAGKPAKAVDRLQKALCLTPGSALLRLDLAGALREAGRPGDALDILDTVHAGADQAADARTLAGLIHFEAGRAERAEACYLAALETEPDHRDAWNDLGALRFVAGRYAEARDCFERALKADAGLADAWFNLADACRELGDERGAARADERYSELARRASG